MHAAASPFCADKRAVDAADEGRHLVRGVDGRVLTQT